MTEMQHNPGRPRVHIVRIACPREPLFGAKGETVPLRLTQAWMRRARVIIKLKSGLNREEFLAADNLCVSIPGQREESCGHVAALNDALTNRR